MIAIRDTSGTERAAGEMRARIPDTGSTPNPAGVQQVIQRVYARDTSGLHQIYQRSIRLAASPSGAYATSTSGTITTNSVTTSVAGGTPPYTHHWTLLSSTRAITISAPNSATTQFTSSVTGGDVLGTARDTVTDSTGLAATIDVTVQFTKQGA